jgi:hypothetical protein
VRSSEFWELVDGEFGQAHGRTLVRDHVLFELANRTAEQALADGEPFREVWFALCRSMDVPESRWWGPDQPASSRSVRRPR